MKKRGVLSLWKAIILVFVGIIGVAGATVLSLYLMGRFDDDYVEPADMNFVLEIDDGAGYYNAILGQFEVSSDFKITISTTTENVTEKKVTLSLRNGQVQNGYISDGIIKVPQEITLNKSFSISLEPQYNSAILEDWIAGGVSTLTAKSLNVLLNMQTVKIAVDVPVYGIDIGVFGSNQTGSTQDVVVGTTFTIGTTFTPENSKYMFSDSSREKEIFFSSTSSYISYDWRNERFVANQRSGNNTDSITVYTFSNSYYQKQILGLYSNITDRELLTSNILRYFEQHPETCLMKTINIKVLDVDVDFVEVGNSGKTFSSFMDQYFVLTAVSANGNGSLQTAIQDSSGASLNSLFGNIGIKIPKNVTGFEVQGGKVMKVVTIGNNFTITKEDFNPSFNYSTAPSGTEYYVLPNASPKEYSDYFWRFSSSSAQDLLLQINFFFENEDGNWQNFFDFDGLENPEKTITFSSEEHDYEEDPAWQNNDTITMIINFDESGNAISSNRDLSKDLNAINTENIYQTVKYFLFIDINDPGYADGLNMQTAFVCKTGVVYKTDFKGQNLTIPGSTAPASGYTLYEIDGSVLTAIKSFSGKVKVVAATIKTDADNKPYTTSEGKYLIVKTSRVKDVMVESTLSIANMEPSISFVSGITPNAAFGNEYYLPAINRNESDSQKTMINFELILNRSEDTVTDAEKVITAFNTGKLKIACLDRNGQIANNYVTWQGLVVKNTGASDITFEGSLIIEEGYFSAGKNSIDKGTYIKLQLQYDDGKEVRTKRVSLKSDTTKDYFYIYYQQPVVMTSEFSKHTDIDGNGDGKIDTIEVNITASSGIQISWGNKTLTGNTSEEIIGKLNDLLSFKFKDQFGNDIDSSSALYNIRFVETPVEGTEDYILSFDSTLSRLQNFVSTQGEPKTTTLTAYIVDREDNFVHVFDTDGNLTPTLFSSQNLALKVTSEGVSSVWYDSNKETLGTPVANDYLKSNSISQVRVEKYVSSNDIIDMNNLLKVYISNSVGAEVGVSNIVYKLDSNFISSLSSSNKLDIMKMIKFNASGSSTGDGDTIESYRNVVISTIDVVNPFKEDTIITFSVRDASETLFDITLSLVLKSDISINQSFNLYYQNNSDYLVQKGNAVGVFAGQSYNLAEYIRLNSFTGKAYSWVNALGTLASLESSQSGVFYSTQDFCSLAVVKTGDVTTGIMLKLDDIYQFKTVSFTLYYGKHSFYACSITITLYVNPNIVIREKVLNLSDSPFVNLENITSTAPSPQVLSESYEIHRMTDYIKNGFSAASLIQSSSVEGNYSFIYNNVSQSKYITIDQNATYSNVYNYNYVSGSVLSLSLGQKYRQLFQIIAKKNGSSSSEIVDAVKVVDNGTEKQVILCEETTTMTISFDVGFGGDDVLDMVSGVLKQFDGSPVEIVTYNNEIHLLLKPRMQTTESYLTQGSFTIRNNSAKGNLYSNIGSTLSTYDISGFMSLTGNSFEVEKTLTDSKGSTLKIVVALKAIVSKIGEQFVYYNNSTLPADAANMKFNEFGAVDFGSIIGNYTSLQSNNVAQTLQAGNVYTVVHDNSEAVLNVQDAFGFYFNGILTEVNVNAANYNLSIVDNAQGYIAGLATIKQDAQGKYTKLSINHLESSMTDAYIVLRFELYTYIGGTTYSWYYRIKVSPSFSVGTVLYPYSEVGEYLDTFSMYYNSITSFYNIDLHEDFSPHNSKYVSGQRFGNLTWIGDAVEIEETYRIKSATVNGVAVANYASYFTYNFAEDCIFTVKLLDNSFKLTLIIEKSFSVGDSLMIGSEMQYILIFNQGSNYVHTLKQKIGTGTETTLAATGNMYSTTLNAGSEEVVFAPSIKISSNGTESKVNEFSAYISHAEENFSGALMLKTFIKKGSKIYSNFGKTLVHTTLSSDLIFGVWQAVEPTYAGETVTVNVLGGTYYVDKSDVSFTYAYLENEKLYIKPQETIEKDMNFEIGFYTDERITFKIDLTVTSYFDWLLNYGVELKGGQKYTILKESGTNIFSKLETKSSLTGRTVADFDITLKNGNVVYEEGVLLSDLISIVAGSNWKETSVEFAHLTKDATFIFEGEITDSAGSPYTFTFELTVKASFVINQMRRFSDTADRYGGLEFEVLMSDVENYFPTLMPKLAGGNTTYTFVDGTNGGASLSITPENVGVSTIVENIHKVACNFNGLELFEFDVRYRYTTKPNVKVETNYPSPDGVTALSAEYISTVQTDGQFMSKEDEYNDFFNSIAPFGIVKRINVSDLAKENSTNVASQKDWRISVASVSNTIIDISGGVSKMITPSSTDMTIMQSLNSPNSPIINFKFTIINSSSNGQVVFDITVNNVTVTYSVVIVTGSVVRISTNTPNYSNNRETIYAEDMVNQPEKELFAQNRILNYQMKPTVTVGTKYHLRFANANKEVQIIEFTVRTLNSIINIDLGKSYTGYSYTGTFTSKTAAENNTEASKVDDNAIYLSIPKLTSRIVAYYYDNTPIVFTSSVKLMLLEIKAVASPVVNQLGNYYELIENEYVKTNDIAIIAEKKYFEYQQTGSAEGFKLTVADYGKVREFEMQIKIGSLAIATSGSYNLYLDIEFEVTGNADDSSNYSIVEVSNAGTERSLLSYSSFGIKNARTGLAYSQESMYASAGSFTLEIYGFTNMKINITPETVTGTDFEKNSIKLANSAGEIHNNLVRTAGKDLDKEVVYFTGLSPRANEVVNTIANGGDVRKNYITLSGVLQQGKTVDYLINVQGANNDGNHVMMKITYMVDVDGTPIEKSHNLLFKVVPNSSIRFKSQHDDSQIINNSSTEIVNGQTVASNSSAPYDIIFNSSASVYFNLWNVNTGATGRYISAIVANMYGSSLNSANQFRYSYTNNLKKDYNDLSTLLSGTFSNWTDNVSQTAETYAFNSGFAAKEGELRINVASLSMGTRSFVFELENSFGYKARFYIRVTRADLNPAIYSMSDYTLEEGQTLAVGLRYQTVTPTKAISGNYVAYDPFTYVYKNDREYTPQEFANQLQINIHNATSNYAISKAMIEAVVVDSYIKDGETIIAAGSKITKKFENLLFSGGLEIINIWSGTTVDNKWEINGVAIAGGISQSFLYNAECTLMLEVVRQGDEANEKPIGYYSAKYLNVKPTQTSIETNKVLTQSHTISSDYERVTFREGNSEPGYSVTLGGINARGYANTLGAIDIGSSVESSVDSIKVKRIDFYLGEIHLGGSTASTGTPAKLITNKNVSFVGSKESGSETITRGEVYNEAAMGFQIPFIEGFYYGTGTTLPNVKMNITLTSGTDECEVVQYVTLFRAAKTENMFNTTIYDNESPAANGSFTVYNDTLEVELDAGESITFAVYGENCVKIGEDNILDYYTKTKDKNIIVGKAYYTKNGVNYIRVTTPVVGSISTYYEIKQKIAKFITLANSKTYTIVEYIGISASIAELEENLTDGSRFYIYVKSKTGKPEINYNGSNCIDEDFGETIVDGKTVFTARASTSKTIQLYNASSLKQRIEHVNELNASNYKNETLYFLFRANAKVYQHVVSFSIFPIYKEAKTSDGNNYFPVDSYMRVSNGTNTYYILTLLNWSNGIVLSRQGTGTASFTMETAYQFNFEINTGTDGSGSAFIDENGMITTTEDFNLVSHTITVNVYVKVSGADGMFETANTRIKLGSFRLFLNSSYTPPSTISAITTGRVYNSSGNIITLPANYEIKYGGAALQNITSVAATSAQNDYSYSVGSKINFVEMFKDLPVLSGVSNRNYHLVKYTGPEDKDVYFNNLNSWTFTTAGTYNLTVVATGRNGTPGYWKITVKIIIYDTSTKEEQQVEAHEGTDTLLEVGLNSKGETIESVADYDYTWYLIDDDGTISKQNYYNSSSYGDIGVGIFTKKYLAENDSTGATKIVMKTFYVYSNLAAIRESVALIPLTSFQLSNLVTLSEGQTVEFYKIQDNTTIVKKTSESFSRAENTSIDAEYIFVIKKDGQIVSMEKHRTTYKFVSSNTTNTVEFIEKSDDMLDVAKTKISEQLSVEKSSLTLEKISPMGILTTAISTMPTELQKDGKQPYIITQDYLVTYENVQGNTRYARFNLTYYVYDCEITILNDVDANNAYSLSSLDSMMVAVVGGTVGSAVSYYQLNGTVLTRIETISVEEIMTKIYYVKVADVYYLTTIVFTIN